MFRHGRKFTMGILVMGTAIALGGGLPQHALAQAAKKPVKDSLGYGEYFERELKKIGQISPQEFARRYPAPAGYLDRIGWDPTTAKFWDEFNRVPNQPPISKRGGYFDYRLNEMELAKFKENGFVVSERMGAGSFAEMFYRIYSRDLPVFISSDALLHAWHRSYDAMLEELEETYLAATLDKILTGHGREHSRSQQGIWPGFDERKPGRCGLFPGHGPLSPGRRRCRRSWVRKHASRTPWTAVKKEGLHEFLLFGRIRQMDFSQFKVRGHYENSELLKKYFKAMMWCGRIDLRIAGGKDYYGALSSPRELGSAVILNDLLLRGKQFDRWQQFDRLIQTFVGRTDSATFAHLGISWPRRASSRRRSQDHGSARRPSKPTSWRTRLACRRSAATSIPPPLAARCSCRVPSRLLGQKFVVDSWVTAKVVFDDILWDDGKRPH